jgi:hypothetical protein
MSTAAESREHRSVSAGDVKEPDLTPDLVNAAIAGRLPHGMGVARLADMPAEWSRQHQMLGLPSA